MQSKNETAIECECESNEYTEVECKNECVSESEWSVAKLISEQDTDGTWSKEI